MSKPCLIAIVLLLFMPLNPQFIKEWLDAFILSPGVFLVGIATGVFFTWLWFKRQISSKDDELRRYRKTLGLESSKNRYQELSDRELAKVTFKLVARIREHVEKNQQVEAAYMVARSTPEEATKEDILQAIYRDKDRIGKENAYDKDFKIDAILLKEALAARNPEMSQLEKAEYERPVLYAFIGPSMTSRIADDLEKLAKSLD